MQDDEQIVNQNEELATSENQSTDEQNVETGNEQPVEGEQVEQAETPEPTDRQTRQERRSERFAERFSDTVRGSYEQNTQNRDQLFQANNNYNPLDYTQADQFDVTQLEQDRNQFGTYQFAQGAKTAQFFADQDRFMDRLENDNDYVMSKYDVLDPESDKFNADLADRINTRYLRTVGFNEQTGTVRETKLRYKQFVKEYMEDLDTYAASRNANSTRNIASQAAQAGIRPGGSSRKSLGELKPGDISKMSDAEYTKYKDEIDRQISSML